MPGKRNTRAPRWSQALSASARALRRPLPTGALSSTQAPPGAYNLADDLPTSQNTVIEEACRLLGREPPPLLSLEAAGLSPQARAFYSENRRVANGKASRVLGWSPRYPDFRSGLRACARAARCDP